MVYYWPPWPLMASSSLQSQKFCFNNSDLSNWWCISINFLFNGSRKSTETLCRKDSQAKINYLEFALTFEICMFFFIAWVRFSSYYTTTLTRSSPSSIHGHSARWHVYNRRRGWEIDFANIPPFTSEEALFLAGRRAFRLLCSFPLVVGCAFNAFSTPQ